MSDSFKSLRNLSDRNALHIANELIKEELREIENFSDIMKHKEEYESMRHKAMSKVKDLELEETKINAGKESIMSKIKSMSKEQQLKENENHLQRAREELKEAEQICKVIDFVLAGDQVEVFKDIRKKNYYRTLRELAKAEKETFQVEEEIWSRIAVQEEQTNENDASYENMRLKMSKLESPPPDSELSEPKRAEK